jgi:hypothetical protein
VVKELRNYLWKVDRDGKSLNVPAHKFPHSMHAARYEISQLLSGKRYQFRVRSPDDD